ncbi:hypothetical protein B0G76_0642 [Paraburkholderia sp. BL23I1N1]|nr:hypothetical protein B0G76_0642 [Paraburkholderia sp. BL23I1N1]
MVKAVILKSLLSEADFFVDEEDLQTFVGATSQSRFFLPSGCRFANADQCAGAAPSTSLQSVAIGMLQSSMT